MVKVLDCGAKGPRFDPHPGQDFFSLLYTDTYVIEVIKNHMPISHGPFFWRRSIGPLPSCLDSLPSTLLQYLYWLLNIPFLVRRSYMGSPYLCMLALAGMCSMEDELPPFLSIPFLFLERDINGRSSELGRGRIHV